MHDPEPFTYDDGNLLTDSRWSYTYDTENRLIAMQTATSVIPNADKRRLEFTYDYLGRRVRKIVRAGFDGSSYTTEASDTKFIYNGWNCIAALNANSSEALVASYFWGMDILGPGQRAGGIGGLLMVQEGGYSYVPAYDALGNVHAMIRTSDGTLSATYEYDAFGQTLRASGTYAESNPLRFSTKYTDNETGLVYFGLRYYSPSLGRFINRDPIGESGGLNLYGYVGNRAANAFDYLGMSPRPDAIANDMNIAKDPEWYDLYGNFGVDGTMPSSAPVVNANFRGLADRMGTFTGMGYLTFYLYAFASELRISFGELVGAIAKENAQARDREKLVRLADYTVRLNTRTGTATGSINGRVVSYEFKSGYGAVLDQMTGQWVRYAPNSTAPAVERSGMYVGSVNWQSTGVFFTVGKFDGYVVDPKTQEVVYIKGSVTGFGVQLGHFSGQQGIAFQANSPAELNRAKGGIFLASAGVGLGPATFFGGEWSAGAYPLAGGGARLIDNQVGPEYLKVSPEMDVLDLMEKPKIGFGFSLSFQGIQINEVVVKAPPLPPPPPPPTPRG